MEKNITQEATWTSQKHQNGKRYWTLNGTDIRIETTGYNALSNKSGAAKSRKGGGYEPRVPRNSGGYIALFTYSTLAEAKAHAERYAANR